MSGSNWGIGEWLAIGLMAGAAGVIARGQQRGVVAREGKQRADEHGRKVYGDDVWEAMEERDALFDTVEKRYLSAGFTPREAESLAESNPSYREAAKHVDDLSLSRPKTNVVFGHKQHMSWWK